MGGDSRDIAKAGLFGLALMIGIPAAETAMTMAEQPNYRFRGFVEEVAPRLTDARIELEDMSRLRIDCGGDFARHVLMLDHPTHDRDVLDIARERNPGCIVKRVDLQLASMD
ncbi:hypothetical protein [Sphingomicrobium sediminis]|uniref:Uncharacterized protein n=1 Tax=Sphingomicrobium sediminis TaxID=2950949 RepID=A0A9X2J2Z9_9SPHN|nr:hypothetical protein [Sphingomicrobium sediminis]MCM8556796.1 hypothetical protein [Sphingomicrobium sediminis]